jgi:hypothetical protein
MKMVLLVGIVAFVACMSADLATKEGSPFHCAEVGWTMRIPAGWEVMSNEEQQALNDRGYDALSEQVEINVDSLRNLVAFRKDPFNSFLSTIEPAEEAYPGEYAENCKGLNALLYDTFVSQGIQVDSSSGMERIQGKDFYLFNTRIHGPDGKVILEQRMYSRLVNGYDHGVTLNYNNDADRDTLLSVWRSSIFAL